jgi:hypothetical protein
MVEEDPEMSFSTSAMQVMEDDKVSEDSEPEGTQLAVSDKDKKNETYVQKQELGKTFTAPPPAQPSDTFCVGKSETKGESIFEISDDEDVIACSPAKEKPQPPQGNKTYITTAAAPIECPNYYPVDEYNDDEMMEIEEERRMSMSNVRSTYDITLYEDLDEENSHRANKVLPDWASNSKFNKPFIFSCQF